MSKKLNHRDVINMGGLHLAAGNAELQFMLQHEEPIGHTEGLYGWNYDVYRFVVDDGTVILSTGYRNMQGLDVVNAEDWNEMAETVDDYHHREGCSIAERREQVRKVINEFCQFHLNYTPEQRKRDKCAERSEHRLYAWLRDTVGIKSIEKDGDIWTLTDYDGIIKIKVQPKLNGQQAKYGLITWKHTVNDVLRTIWDNAADEYVPTHL